MMNHLYQDLGFQNRMQMARFMQYHFPKLSANKPKEVLWKKYIYDLIGEVAPACALCSDQENCFKCKL
jgi:nitrogen fixation protein NifQ